VKTLIDFDAAPIFAIPMRSSAQRPREGMLIEGPQGWGEFSPEDGRAHHVLARWLTAATEAGTVGWPDPVRGRVPVAVTVPATDAARAHEMVANAGCRTADVTVAERRGSLGDDIARVQAVRDALGPDAAIRCDAKGRWDVDAAVSAITALDRAADGLEFVAQPCRTLDELAEVRRKVDVRIAIDESVRDAQDPGELSLAEAADVVVLTCGPLGGVRRALRLAETYELPCVVVSTAATSIGAAAALALAGALPELLFACGLGTRLLLAGDLVSEQRSLAPIDGYLPVAPMPSAPDPDRIKQFAVTDQATIARWRERLHLART
jgi:O-succinylbenzoate synthase